MEPWQWGSSIGAVRRGMSGSGSGVPPSSGGSRGRPATKVAPWPVGGVSHLVNSPVILHPLLATLNQRHTCRQRTARRSASSPQRPPSPTPGSRSQRHSGQDDGCGVGRRSRPSDGRFSMVDRRRSGRSSQVRPGRHRTARQKTHRYARTLTSGASSRASVWNRRCSPTPLAPPADQGAVAVMVRG